MNRWRGRREWCRGEKRERRTLMCGREVKQGYYEEGEEREIIHRRASHTKDVLQPTPLTYTSLASTINGSLNEASHSSRHP